MKVKMSAFLTGSRAYGTPREDSDWDLVVCCNTDTMWQLKYNGDLKSPYKPTRFGNLNLIVVDDVEKFKKWKRVTEELKALGRPVPKDEAKAAFVKAMPEYAKQAVSDN